MPMHSRRAFRAFSASIIILPALAFATDDAWWHDHRACLEHRLEALPQRKGDRNGHFDPATGRDTRNYPPHTSVDFERLELDLDIPDMNQPRLSGVATYLIRPRAPVSVLKLWAGPRESMTISAVSIDGDATAARIAHEGETLTLTFGRPLEAGVGARLSIAYALNSPHEGLTWTPESPAWPGRAAQLHTQGQPESNHYWFPCHDFPNERMAQVVRVAVPKGYLVSSNGVLTGQKTVGERDVFEWTLDKGHVSYLASLVVGKFDRVELTPVPAGPGGAAVSMEVYAPAGMGDRVARTYDRTGAMMRFFADYTGTPYPWGRYAQLVVHNFGAGGMENTAATTMFDTAILDETALLDGDLDGLISHELAHQWFGDLVTCHSWEHIWLNEGFATYFTHLWFQHRDGDDAYLAALFDTRAGLVTSDPADPAPAPERPGMCSKEYAHPWEVFRRGANPYPKGAFILHMLRERLGEGPFRAGIADHLAKRSLQTAETSDLREAFERASGDRLEGFFEQWCNRPGVPIVRVSPSWNEVSRTLTLRAEQLQPMDGYNPAFEMRIPVRIALSGSGGGDGPVAWHDVTIEMNSREAEVQVALSGSEGTGPQPRFVAVDPRASVLADFRVQQPLEAWVRQLAEGPTIVSRLHAAAALGEVRDMKVAADRTGPSSASVALLATARHGTGRAANPFQLRIGAIKALGARNDFASLFDLGTSGEPDARVRMAIIQALGGLTFTADAPREAASGLALEWLGQDRSYGVRAAAARALTTLRDDRALERLVRACEWPSQHDQIRVATVEALATLDDPRGLDAVIAAAGPGMPARTRPTALKAAGSLMKHNPARVWSLLSGALEDPQERTRRAAAEALAATGDPRAKVLLEGLANSPSGAERASARQWLKDWASAAEAKANAVPPVVAAPPPPMPQPQPSSRKQGFTGGQPVGPGKK